MTNNKRREELIKELNNLAYSSIPSGYINEVATFILAREAKIVEKPSTNSPRSRLC